MATTSGPGPVVMHVSPKHLAGFPFAVQLRASTAMAAKTVMKREVKNFILA
ncbi:hypothetical protein PoMZ_07057 [Pyricularia oryzae]|uniref:Uncharacterized protein n=1 Tax=Pyricularia oryzae TaxID=318829 RepID=A0A4P7NE57_PYROR|nr:hypothetical protein PoMZ_07057 [Pyricularia oryzae]